jgi:5-methylcytosine-specific restriction protein B
MKYMNYSDSPISISIFVEKNNGVTRYRISLDIKNDGVSKEVMTQYHSHLDLPIHNNMVYVSGSNKWGNPEVISDSQENIQRKIESGVYRKVQLCIYVEPAEGKTNQEYDAEVRAAVNELIPYYEHVVGKKSDEVMGTMNLSTVEFDKNIILYGPPGTGKTYHTVIYAVAICEGKSIEEIGAEPYNDVMTRYTQLKKDGRIAFTTFHQSYGYEEFIEGIKPVVDGSKTDLSYTIEPGVFKRFCDNAESTYNEVAHVFIIDEINRGNISKIFGELITLIEDTKRKGMEEQASAILPYSGEEFSIPKNVYILGTMNTADRSIALMDTALRRRFRFKEMLPDHTLLRGVTVKADGQSVNIDLMLKIINERITYLYDREHTLGHAFFMGLKVDNSIENLAAIFENSVIPLLQEYFYEDYEKICLVLGDNAKKDVSTQFVAAEDIPQDTFEGDVSDEFDIPDKKYTILYDNFTNIMAYKGISRKL